MRFLCVYLCMFLCCGAFNAPVWAQKTNIKKTVKKALEVTKQSGSSASNAALRHAWSSSSVKAASQAERILNPLMLKSNQAQLHKLLTDSFFHMYNEEQGLLASITNIWSELLSDYYLSFFGPRQINPISPAEARQNLLQKEALLNQSLQKWRKLKPALLNKVSQQQCTDLAKEHTATRFFFENFPRLDPFAREIALYISGEKDLMHIIAAGQPEVEYVYRRLMAFAHKKEPFPFLSKEVYRILELPQYSMEELTLLAVDLNSPGCDQLREWGWDDAAIREIIQLYQSDYWAEAYQTDYVLNFVQLQHDLISNWRAYWNSQRNQDLEATRQLLNGLNASR